MKARVVGCGVCGLSAAIRLAERGFEVEAWTRESPARTTSAVAPAIWYPFKTGPADKVARWASETRRELIRLARDASSGVVLRRGIELITPNAPRGSGAFQAAPEEARELPAGDLPRGFVRGFELTLPVAEMPIYLAYLERRLRSLGAHIVERKLRSLDEALQDVELVVNCSGLGARELAADRTLFPIRGQVVRVERGGIDQFLLDDYDEKGVTYVVPRSNDCVLGTTVEVGVGDLTPDESSTRDILERCAALVPALKGARVLSVSVGLRPGRAEVRLEAEPRPGGKRVIHDYGHGGGGVSLSWGCANDVVALASARPAAHASS
jgi:D-amino-acid oxidase